MYLEVYEVYERFIIKSESNVSMALGIYFNLSVLLFWSQSIS